MDLLDDPDPGENAHEYTVSEISGAVKRVLEDGFGRVRVKGEVGRVFTARSGHLYFDVKDDRNVLASVAWKGQVGRLTTRPEEGMEVVATGRLTTFGSQSKYQLNVDDLRPAGVGALMAMLEKRKAQLQSEGLFDEARKRPLPYLPEIIGVVTSPSGAVIRDILHRLRERFPRRVLVWPVAVQGRDCAAEVARAIEGFNALSPGGALPRPDLLIVARGGGSIEDLWGFNEEVVARAAAASDIPLISAVGHETDTTLIDYVSDRRAPTPTAAAELAVPVRADLLVWLGGQGDRLGRALLRGVSDRRRHVEALSRALPRPETLLTSARQRLDMLDQRLEAALERSVSRRRARLVELGGGLRPASVRQGLGARRRQLDGNAMRLGPALGRAVAHGRDRLDRQALSLARLAPPKDVDRLRQKLSDHADRMTRAERRGIDSAARRLESLDRLRLSLGYEATLSRGYAVVRGDGQVVTTANAARKATKLEIQFADGRMTPAAGKPQKKAKPDPSPPPEQGKLL
ncbi:exodeoxyribonuclease VII large subunit [Palleronia sp. LCG004]|uniref:exodeoxyribonuclease VII large subunit n=1 Tax=Palleronia sp. LCG004 TaxID=3079304 RepID=UPI002941CFA1|nr:exodeoxyribonuclease VII large subunit [Palleronia sp. LCG004]WOI57581.1 exodeoxyribonuclease VII large subunit [Palleronia sp. LCG004]